MTTRKILAAAAAATALTAASPAFAQGCPREQLEGMTESWIEAIETGSMLRMELGEWVDYSENFKRASLGGFLNEPREVSHYLSVMDTTTCRIMVEAVLLDEEDPMVIATQIGNGYFGVGPFNNIVTREGDWLFNAQATYDFARQEDWSEIPESERMSRDELIAIADSYLDLFSDPTVEVPWGTPCARLEGGMSTERDESTNSCNVGIPEGVELTERDYTVDPVIGAVDVFLKFGENELPDSHLFRIEDGKIRYIHTVTNCLGTENCGFDPVDPS